MIIVIIDRWEPTAKSFRSPANGWGNSFEKTEGFGRTRFSFVANLAKEIFLFKPTSPLSCLLLLSSRNHKTRLRDENIQDSLFGICETITEQLARFEEHELEERQRGEYPNRIYILPKGIIIVIPSLVACNLHRRIEKLLKLEPLKKRPRGERNTGSGGDARGGGIKRWVGLKGETTKERRKVVEGG